MHALEVACEQTQPSFQSVDRSWLATAYTVIERARLASELSDGLWSLVHSPAS